MIVQPAGELARLLARHRGVRNRLAAPALTLGRVHAWACAHLRRTGKWPVIASGPVPEAPGETWALIDRALRDGSRGLPGGSSLIRLRDTIGGRSSRR